MTPERLSARFGAALGEAVRELPLGQWSGPVESSYGLHLVWPHESHPPDDDEEQSARQDASKAQVGAEAHQRASLQEALQILRQDVDVIRYDRPAPP